MKKIIVKCPICNKVKIIPVPREVFDLEEGSLLKLPIKDGLICEHKFLIILDFNFSIRDYEVPDKRNYFLTQYFR